MICEMGKQKRTVQITINLPMYFPKEWDDAMIEFHLNESSWCADNFIDALDEYSEENGCICGITKAKVLPVGQESMETSQKPLTETTGRGAE